MGTKSKSLESKSREEKLKMMKTKQTRKLTRKLSRMEKKGKLRKGVIDKIRDIKDAKSVDSRKRIRNVEEDYFDDRDLHFNDDQEDCLPLDMLDADIDWENSAFATSKRRRLEKEAQDEAREDADDLEGQRRRFEGQLDDDEMELLPIKLKDGTLLRPTQKKEKKKEDEDDEDGGDGEHEDKVDPLEGLSAAELVIKRREMLEEQKQTISGYSMNLLADPQTNIFKLRELVNLCSGSGVHPLIKESVQKLAIASTVQVLIDIIPGYSIRPLSETEKEQQVTKETKKLQTFEEALLRYHLKFLQLCEKNFKRLRPSLDASTFSSTIGMLSLRVLCRLLTSAPHFNYSTNIVTAIVKIVLNGHKEAIDEVCTTLGKLFKDDLHLKMSLFAVRAVHDVVKMKVSAVPPSLLFTFLSLKINKVQNEDQKSGKGLLIGKKLRLQRERGQKSKRKYDRQLQKLECDLKEVDAAESLSTKLKTATECMKQVFHIYFSVLRRMPSLALLEPVLEGLSKFAHLLNVEFFADMIKCMEELIDQKHLRVMDSLHCVHTVFVILSGDGQALNVDPYRFYKSVYQLLSALPFEKDPVLRRKECSMMSRCLDKMFNARRKQVPLARVAAFARRILLTCVVLDDISALPLMATTRTFFIAFPKLVGLVEVAEEEEGGGSVMFRADFDDPDSACAVTSDATLELHRLAKRRHRLLASLGRNMLHGVPSAGPNRVDPNAVSCRAWDLGADETSHEEAGALSLLQSQAKKNKKKTGQESLNCKNLYSRIITLLENDK